MFNYYSIIWIIRIFLQIRIRIFLPKCRIFRFGFENLLTTNKIRIRIQKISRLRIRFEIWIRSKKRFVTTLMPTLFWSIRYSQIRTKVGQKVGSKKKETSIASEWTSESWLKLLLGHTVQYTISNTGRIYCKSRAPAQRDHNLQFVQTIELDQAFHFIIFYNGNIKIDNTCFFFWQKDLFSFKATCGHAHFSFIQTLKINWIQKCRKIEN